MTATTIFGTAHAVGGISRTFSRSGRIDDAHIIRSIELELPDDGLHVTADHDEARVVGEVAYAELAEDGRLNVVSVLEGDWAHQVEEPIFYSGLFDCRGSRDDLGGRTWAAAHAYLIGMSVTFSPASLEARALSVIAGDLRSSVDRGGWSCSWDYHHPLLKRALEHLPKGETRARWITGPPPKVTQMGDGAWLVNDRLMTTRERRPPGSIEYWPPIENSIISVRSLT